MKAFLIALAVVAALSAGAWVALDSLDASTAAVYQNPESVRLSDPDPDRFTDD